MNSGWRNALIIVIVMLMGFASITSSNKYEEVTFTEKVVNIAEKGLNFILPNNVYQSN